MPLSFLTLHWWFGVGGWGSGPSVQLVKLGGRVGSGVRTRGRCGDNVRLWDNGRFTLEV